MLFKRNKPVKQPVVVSETGSSASPAREPSFVARDASFEGNIFSNGEIHIDGELRGHVRAHTCLVEQHGVVIGGIFAQFVVVRGRVIGPISARQVTIQSGAHVEGDVVHEGLAIERGAYVLGSISQSDLTESFADTEPTILPELGNANHLQRKLAALSEAIMDDEPDPFYRTKMLK